MVLDDSLYGAKFEEIVGLMEYVARDESDDAKPWAKFKGQYLKESLIAGITLRVRHVYHEKGLSQITLSGRGWMISFKVTRHRPRSFTDDVPSMPHHLTLVPGVDAPRPGGSQWSAGGGFHPVTKRLTLHTPAVLSPDEFQKEMALLRMFSSEWSNG